MNTQGGILAVCKPEGISSARVVAIIKKKFSFNKVGHFGTLDPFAKGLILIGVEQGTKLSALLMDWPKTYWASVKLGVRTDTLDPTGKIVAQSLPPWPSEAEIEAETKKWVGNIEQKVPMYSAVKIKGMRLYNAARRGIELDPPIKNVSIFSIQVLSINESSFEIEVFCSKGTYLRTLASDIASGLGHEGMLSSLSRLKIGKYKLEDAITMETLENMTHEELYQSSSWQSLSHSLDEIPKVRLSERIATKVMQGQVPLVPPVDSEYIRLCNQDDNLVGLLKKNKEGWALDRVFPI